ncbi:hypothetical protein BT93_F1073 [Corymbia citriodora subsp. variegata]|nr:hypothetical protein BT93_F1073 [Corymbia citriodora subsp. variegata]
MVNNNSTDLDHIADTWSLGCTITEMITDKPPWILPRNTLPTIFVSLFSAQAIFKVMLSSLAIPKTLYAEGKDFLQCCFRRQPAKRPSPAMLREHAFLQI